ncbi:DNA-directed RNA polymerase subunit alpha C-terminal domain-containing protein ['Paenibacillus yunnanensis' Narsing Rao et al. 2020]|uniref:DNA-directed RNA polymerase subunit alpha C-terminal domain-containing protein n=1 Tax=Paenibacillus tengchongensis TaxID=2608684 RepID=UPI0016522817|nr:DNA-directed RNA polymerase subunit alpha C-terminal domain-containing protein [Paenibacillus tengchongensis]
MGSTFTATGTPLKYQFPMDEVYYKQSIYILASGSRRNPRSIARVLNALHDNGLRTIGDVLRTSLDDLLKLRNFGSTGQQILLELLENFGPGSNL